MHWNRSKPVAVLVFSSPQLGADVPPPTELAKRPVALGDGGSKWPTVLSWLIIAGGVGLALSRRGQPTRFSAGPDAPTLLAREARRIQRRVERRRRQRQLALVSPMDPW